MVLIGMDVDNPESDFVGFSIEEQEPGSTAFVPLRNRLNFSYGKQTAAEAVDGFRNFLSHPGAVSKVPMDSVPLPIRSSVYTPIASQSST